MLDDSTPREVWLEYEERKRAIRVPLDPFVYYARIEQIEAELGIGVARERLTPAQARRQKDAIERWGKCEP